LRVIFKAAVDEYLEMVRRIDERWSCKSADNLVEMNVSFQF
jgi:hypothetical protein